MHLSQKTRDRVLNMIINAIALFTCYRIAITMAETFLNQSVIFCSATFVYFIILDCVEKNSKRIPRNEMSMKIVDCNTIEVTAITEQGDVHTKKIIGSYINSVYKNITIVQRLKKEWKYKVFIDNKEEYFHEIDEVAIYITDKTYLQSAITADLWRSMLDNKA